MSTIYGCSQLLTLCCLFLSTSVDKCRHMTAEGQQRVDTSSALCCCAATGVCALTCIFLYAAFIFYADFMF